MLQAASEPVEGAPTCPPQPSLPQSHNCMPSGAPHGAPPGIERPAPQVGFVPPSFLLETRSSGILAYICKNAVHCPSHAYRIFQPPGTGPRNLLWCSRWRLCPSSAL